MTTLTARLHPKWVGGRDGYHYSVICRGELIVDRSRDPECDAARALLARGITGKLTMLDGKTGRPRTIVDVEKAAKGPRYRRRPGWPQVSPCGPGRLIIQPRRGSPRKDESQGLEALWQRPPVPGF